MVFWVKTPILLQFLIPNVTWRKKNLEKVIFLTFDDGPIPIVTPAILEILKKFNAKATFFCVGENVKTNRDIFDKLLEDGHSVGNHTFNHLNGSLTKTKDYLNNVSECAKYVNSKLFRPPFGRLRWSQKRFLKKHYDLIYWDVLSWDFDSNITKEKCLTNVLENTKSGSIVLFHDSIKSEPRVLYALPRVLEHFSELGFTFQKL